MSAAKQKEYKGKKATRNVRYDLQSSGIGTECSDILIPSTGTSKASGIGFTVDVMVEHYHEYRLNKQWNNPDNSDERIMSSLK